MALSHAWPLALVAAAIAWPVPQSADTLDALLEKLGVYLTQYESDLATVVAFEHYRQSQVEPRPGPRALENVIGRIRNRTLESEVAFMALPGSGEWYGIRDVLRIDGEAVAVSGPRLLDILGNRAAGSIEQVRAIVQASSAHNLGGTRTINMPTVPLELLRPRHRERFTFEHKGGTRVSGTEVVELRFEEHATPSLVGSADGRPLFASGRVWFEPGSGRVWRVEVHFEIGTRVRDAKGLDNELRVDFTPEPTLELMVPREMRETLALAGGGRLEGRAVYSNFRRFTTTARILPPPG